MHWMAIQSVIASTHPRRLSSARLVSSTGRTDVPDKYEISNRYSRFNAVRPLRSCGGGGMRFEQD